MTAPGPGQSSRIQPCPSCGAARSGPICSHCGVRTDTLGFPDQVVHHGPVTLSVMAVVSLVLGLTWLGGCGSILAITFGVIALAETRSPTKSGRGLAWAGIGLGVVGVLVICTLPFVVHFDDASTSTTLVHGCRKDLNAISDATQSFFDDNHRYPSSLQELIDEDYLPHDTVTARASDWSYDLKPSTGLAAPKFAITTRGRDRGCNPVQESDTVSTTLQTTGPVGLSRLAACATELQTLRTAEETFAATNGHYATVQELIDAKILAGPPTYYLVTPDGSKFTATRTPEGTVEDCPAP